MKATVLAVVLGTATPALAASGLHDRQAGHPLDERPRVRAGGRAVRRRQPGRRRLRGRPGRARRRRRSRSRSRSPTSRASWRRCSARQPSDVMVHDLAVDPVSQAPVPLGLARPRRLERAVAAARTTWPTPRVLVRFDAAGTPEVVDLSSVALREGRAAEPDRRRARRSSGRRRRCARTPSPTSAYADGTLYVAGLSNEEFAATMWKVAYPFDGPGLDDHHRELPRRARQVRDGGARAHVRALSAQGQDAPAGGLPVHAARHVRGRRASRTSST